MNTSTSSDGSGSRNVQEYQTNEDKPVGKRFRSIGNAMGAARIAFRHQGHRCGELGPREEHEEAVFFAEPVGVRADSGQGRGCSQSGSVCIMTKKSSATQGLAGTDEGSIGSRAFVFLTLPNCRGKGVLLYY